MTLAHPLWLLGLLPWAGVVLYLLLGRRKREPVPFLELWKGPVKPPPARRRLTLPPAAVLLLLLAVLAAILGAAGPWVRGGETGEEPVSVVVDVGLTMSAQGEAGPRFKELAEAVSRELVESFGADQPVEWLAVPGRAVEESDAARWAEAVAGLEPTAVDTREALRAAVAGKLREGGGPVVVLSDQAFGIDDERLVQVAPPGSVDNAGIVAVAAREVPRPQVMARLGVTGRASGEGAVLSVRTGGRAVDQPIKLPASGEEDYFVDLDAGPGGLGRTVEVQLRLAGGSGDDLPADDRAWLVREAGWPRVEARSALPPEVQRVVELYGATRPPAEGAPVATVVGGGAGLDESEPGVVLARSAESGGDAASDLSPARRVEHPVTGDVDWDAVLSADLSTANLLAVPADAPAGRGWEPVVSVGERVCVAVRASPARQVWVGIDPRRWSTRVDFVVFWAKALDWVGGVGGDGVDGQAFAAFPVGDVEGRWERVESDGPGGGDGPVDPSRWPGLYRRVSDGALRAVNVPPVARGGAAPSDDWRRRLAEWGETSSGAGGRVALGPALLTLAIALACASALLWQPGPEGRVIRRPGGGRHRGRRVASAVRSVGGNLTGFWAGRRVLGRSSEAKSSASKSSEANRGSEGSSRPVSRPVTPE